MDIETVVLNNGVRIPQVGLGVFQTPSGHSTVDAVREALLAGYRHIDTAMIYRNEESVGEGLRQSGLMRDEVFVTTKLWNDDKHLDTAMIYRNEESVGEGLRQSGLMRDEVFVTTKLWNDDIRAGRARQAYEESLERLGLDAVDLYLVHWPADGWERAWECLQGLYANGRVRAIGVSNFQRHHLERLMSLSDVVPAVDQIESSPQFANQELVDYAQGKGIAVEAWSPLGGTGGNLLSDPRLAPIAARHGKSPAQVVIRWHVQRGVIVLPKSVHADRIRQNAEVFDFALDSQEMQDIAAIDTGVRNGADPDDFDF